MLVVAAGVLLFIAGRLQQDARRFAIESVEVPVVSSRVVPATASTGTVYELTYRLTAAAGPGIERTEVVPVSVWETAAASGGVRLKPPLDEPRIWQPPSTTTIRIVALVGLVLLLPPIALGIAGVRRAVRRRQEIPDSPSRGARLLARASFWTVFGSIWLTVGLPFILLAGFFAWQDWQLTTAGRAASGLVLLKDINRSGSGSGSGSFRRTVLYRFEAPDGRVRERRAEVPETMWTGLAERGPVSIEYVQDRAWIHRVAGTNERTELAIFGGVGLLVAGAGALIVRADWRRKRRAARLREIGVRALATVVSVDALNVRVNGEQVWRIRYEYLDSEHRTQRGSAYVRVEEAQRWTKGDKAAVLFDPAKPRSTAWVGEATEAGPRRERAAASEPRERSGEPGGPASERAGGFAGAKPPGIR